VRQPGIAVAQVTGIVHRFSPGPYVRFDGMASLRAVGSEVSVGSSAGMRWWAATLLAGCLLVAAGCDGDADETAPTPETESPTTEDSTEPTTAAGPVEPTLPPEAEGSSPQAAKAFVRYYVDILNYAFVTGDVQRLRFESSKDCAGCEEYAVFIRDMYEAGGFYDGEGWFIDQVRPTANLGTQVVFTVSGQILSARYKESKSDEVKYAEPESLLFSLGLREEGNSWKASSIVAGET
jgi:hypothetical protein